MCCSEQWNTKTCGSCRFLIEFRGKDVCVFSPMGHSPGWQDNPACPEWETDIDHRLREWAAENEPGPEHTEEMLTKVKARIAEGGAE